jgi:hypothetical protein
MLLDLDIGPGGRASRKPSTRLSLTFGGSRFARAGVAAQITAAAEEVGLE